MKSIPPTYRRLRKLVVSLMVASLLFVALFVVHSQNPQTPQDPPLKGETGKVLVLPNSTVNAGEIKFKADTDSDGMPDDVEVSNGTNPNDPSDADADADHDGLTNGDEVAGGTDVNNADTDGDGVSDGEEARLGFSPTDGNSTPPPNVILTSLEITPNPARISINTQLGQDPLQLRVIGVRNNGTTADLTGSPTLTYQSSNTSVVIVDSFGNLGGTGPGQTTIRVTAGNIFADVQVVVTQITPTPLGSVAIPGYANNVDIAGDFAYVAAGSAGLVVVYVNDRTAPTVLATLDTSGNANDVRVVGTIAYVADGISGLKIINVNNPQAPVLMATIDTPGEAYDVVVRGNRAYVADGGSGIRIINVTNPAAPVLIGTVDTPGFAKGIDVSGDLIVVADDNPGSVIIIDAAVPATPQIVGRLLLGSVNAVDLEVRDRFAYVAAFSGGMRVVDFSVPSAPILIGGLSQFRPRDVALGDRYGVAAEVQFTNAVPVFDLDDPSTPGYRGAINFAGDSNGTGVAIDDQYFYMTGSNDAFSTVKGVSGSTRLFIGKYKEPAVPIIDSAGIAPAVTITSPQTGQSIIEGGALPISITATDDVKVSLVQLIVNGVVVIRDVVPPYNLTYTIPLGLTTITIEAKAFDVGGNVATSAPVTLNVLPDPPPSISIFSPVEGAQLTAQRVIQVLAFANDNVAVDHVEFKANGTALASDFTVPYEASYSIPVGTTSLLLEATAVDNLGRRTSATRTFSVGPQPPPSVSILSPKAGSLLIEGQVYELLAQASDDTGVSRVVFTVGGVTLPADTSAPFQTTFTVPTGVTSLTISATATDPENASATTTQTFAVTPPIPTTVTGRVITITNQPVAGANVSVFGQFTAQTNPDGTFSILNVPTSQGPISATATATVEGEELSGVSLAVSPVPGGVTNVNNVLLQSVRYETNIGNLITFPGPTFDDKFAAVTLPFSFNFYGINYTQVFVGTNGYLTFGGGELGFNESPTNSLNGRPRIAVLHDDWFPDQTAARGIFVNTQLPNRVVFTWHNVEHNANHTNDEVNEEGNFQVILFSDGRIQFGYRRVETLGGLVGITPGGTPEKAAIKHTAAIFGTFVGSTTAPYEQFLGVGDKPFDLQNTFITYTPISGFYEVKCYQAPQTTVKGRILDPNGSPVSGARVTVLNRTAVTEPDGSFNLEKVPAAEGLLTVKTLWVAPGGQLFQGQSQPTQPLVNSLTDIGDLMLAARGEAFETDLGQPVPHPGGSFPKTQLPLAFPFRFYGQSFYGQTYNQVYINPNGLLSLNATCVKSGCNDVFGLTNTAINDLIFAFANSPVIAPFFSTLDPGNTGEVYVKSLPDKWVMTFVNVRQPNRPETNTFQVVLHADGTIRFAYNGIGNKHAHVGLSVGLFWGMSEQINFNVNWSNTLTRRMPNAYPFFETFTGDFGGQQSGDNFDLDRNVMVFFPNDNGSYDVIRQQFTGVAPPSKILFDSNIDGDVDLFSINGDGSDRVNLTNSRGDDYDPALSPDGTRIAFDSYRDDPDVAVEEIYVMNVNGTGVLRLTNNTADDFAPIWSPDGSKILFRSNRNGNYEIFMMNADGSDQHSLTGYSGDFAPIFSPDGTKILFNSDRDGLGGFYIMNADGSGITHVANTGTFNGNNDASGSWSPDGTRIAFHSYRNGEGEIFIVNADGSGLFNLSNHPSADFSPRWSPDGTKISFESWRDGNFKVYVINADGSGLVKLTNMAFTEFFGGWSPDGTQIAIDVFDGFDSVSLYVINANGTGQRQLVNNSARNFIYQWKNIP